MDIIDFILYATGLIILIFIARYIFTAHFRKNVKQGSRVKFYILRYKFEGRVLRVDPGQVLVEYYYDEGRNFEYRIIPKDNIYPAW